MFGEKSKNGKETKNSRYREIDQFKRYPFEVWAKFANCKCCMKNIELKLNRIQNGLWGKVIRNSFALFFSPYSGLVIQQLLRHIFLFSLYKEDY